MKPLRLPLALLALAGLQACVVPVPVPPGTPGSVTIDPGDPCGARGLQDFVGEPVEVVEDTTFEGAGPIRILRPGEAATTDMLPARVNFHTDAAGLVVAVECG